MKDLRDLKDFDDNPSTPTPHAGFARALCSECLVHKKTPPLLGPAKGPRDRLTVRSEGVVVSHKRGTSVMQDLEVHSAALIRSRGIRGCGGFL